MTCCSPGALADTGGSSENYLPYLARVTGIPQRRQKVVLDWISRPHVAKNPLKSQVWRTLTSTSINASVAGIRISPKV
jgi:hypothetical protein